MQHSTNLPTLHTMDQVSDPRAILMSTLSGGRIDQGALADMFVGQEPESIKGKELVAMVLPKGVRDDPGRKAEVEAVAELLQKLGAEVVPHRRAGGSEDGLDELPGLDEEAEVGMATDALLESPEFKSSAKATTTPPGTVAEAPSGDKPEAKKPAKGIASGRFVATHTSNIEVHACTLPPRFPCSR